MKQSEDAARVESIDTFVSSFVKHIKTIASIKVSHNAKRYKKILYVTALEGIAKARYPNKSPGDRFIKLVHNCGNWADAERISLPHLVAALERTSDPRFEPLRQFAYSMLRDWGSGGPVYLDRDPAVSKIQSLWPKEGDGALVPMADALSELQTLRHAALLYSYRNYLVHESRQPTAGFEKEDDIVPFYESINMHPTVFGNRVSEWHLVYPAGFLELLCGCCLSFLEEYLKTNKKDPYLSFKDGWYLVEHFNYDKRFPVVRPFYKG
jgi:hypothetical protein